MNNEGKVIPAASFEEFGHITEEFNLNLFMKDGHRPIAIEFSDVNLMHYTEEAREITGIAIPNQRDFNGSVLYVKCLFSTAYKLGGKTLYYRSLYDAKRIDTLYNDLVKAYTLAIESAKKRLLYAEAKETFDARIADKTAFKVFAMQTLNLNTKDVCYWKTGTFKVQAKKGKTKIEKRIKLDMLNGTGTEFIDYDTLSKAADSMFKDVCTIENNERPECAQKAKDKEAKRKGKKK